MVIEKFENALQVEGMNRTLYWAYEYSKKAMNQRIDFSEVIWENEVEEIVRQLHEAGVTEFTISSTFSGLISVLAEFERNGCRLKGMTNVFSRYTDLITGEQKLVPAVKMEI